MKYAITVHRIDPSTAKKTLIAKDTWDANENVAEEIGEYAGNMIAEAVSCDVAMLADKEKTK